MTLDKFENEIENLSKSEIEMFKEFIMEDQQTTPAAQNVQSSGVEARAKDLELDQIVEITQELSDGSVKRFKFKVIEIWPAPTHFFTVVSLEKPKDELNYWTLFYDNTWYIKKASKSLINVHVRLI